LTNQNVLKASCYDLKPDFNDCEYKANKGSSVAQYNLGKLYRAGTVVEQDFTKAILWFRKSSAQRNHKALNALRDMLHKKQGFSDDGVNESKENNRQVLHRSKIVQRTTGDKTNKREPGDGYSVADATVAVGSLNAARSAKQYLRTSGFSRKGLIKQLSSDYGDGYNVADATVAVGSLNIDWDKQAARSAKQYLRTSGFSCKGLIKQLSSDYGDGYTVRQATYGARQAGAC
ncbi:MAG TPA: hypothetical protein EYQ26_12415, partial [Rhodospirillales bacterium]|nr:hypothetical protein [Rhodospirillales bacterium]